MGADGGRSRSTPRIALADDVELVRTLFREYADGIGVDLSFQGFDEELAALPAGYDVILVAWLGEEAAGCVGVRPFAAGICEMKRLYVRPSARGAGVGRALAEAVIERARALGYVADAARHDALDGGGAAPLPLAGLRRDRAVPVQPRAGSDLHGIGALGFARRSAARFPVHDPFPARLKQKIPFGIRLRARKLADAIVSFPRDQASFSLGAVGPLHRRYQAWYWQRHLSRFFAPMLRPGDLVFDVGANVGVWTRGLAHLGCRVIAVEPQPLLGARIRQVVPAGADVAIVAAAVGAEAGEADLFLGSIDSLATTSRSWMERMVERGGVPAKFWSESIRVSVRTLDDLIDEFGVPAYVKLDVEGGELDAVKGLTRPSISSPSSHTVRPWRTPAASWRSCPCWATTNST